MLLVRREKLRIYGVLLASAVTLASARIAQAQNLGGGGGAGPVSPAGSVLAACVAVVVGLVQRLWWVGIMVWLVMYLGPPCFMCWSGLCERYGKPARIAGGVLVVVGVGLVGVLVVVGWG